jgi:hypothetical protein
MKKKLASRYIGPFEITKRIGHVAYKLALPPHLRSRSISGPTISPSRNCWRFDIGGETGESIRLQYKGTDEQEDSNDQGILEELLNRRGDLGKRIWNEGKNTLNCF